VRSQKRRNKIIYALNYVELIYNIAESELRLSASIKSSCFWQLLLCTFVPLKKIFCILFPIYFIALVVMPCSDKENCNGIYPTQLSQLNHHAEHSDEICSPFCVCACCATHFLVNDFLPVLNQVSVINTIYTDHNVAQTSSTIVSIWQPPKLV
jgi:hypothetical protein